MTATYGLLPDHPASPVFRGEVSRDSRPAGLSGPPGGLALTQSSLPTSPRATLGCRDHRLSKAFPAIVQSRLDSGSCDPPPPAGPVGRPRAPGRPGGEAGWLAGVICTGMVVHGTTTHTPDLGWSPHPGPAQKLRTESLDWGEACPASPALWPHKGRAQGHLHTVTFGCKWGTPSSSPEWGWGAGGECAGVKDTGAAAQGTWLSSPGTALIQNGVGSVSRC